MSASGSSPTLADEIAAGLGITTVQIARQLNVSPPTPFRWILKGLPDGNGGRIKLQAILRGKKWLTSQAALARFFAALPSSAPAEGAVPSPVSHVRAESKRRTDDERAAAILRSKGF